MIMHMHARHVTLAICVGWLAALHVRTCGALTSTTGERSMPAVVNSTLLTNGTIVLNEPEVNVLFILVQTCNSKPAATMQVRWVGMCASMQRA